MQNEVSFISYKFDEDGVLKMKCSLCPNIALRMVGTSGFCKTHRPEADKAAVRDQKKSQSRRGMLDILRWDTGRFIQQPESAAADHDVH